MKITIDINEKVVEERQARLASFDKLSDAGQSNLISDILMDAYKKGISFHTAKSVKFLPELPEDECYLIADTRDIPEVTDYLKRGIWGIERLLDVFKYDLKRNEPEFIFEFYDYYMDGNSDDFTIIYIKRRNPYRLPFSSPEEFANRIMMYLEDAYENLEPISDYATGQRKLVMTHSPYSRECFDELTKGYKGDFTPAARCINQKLQEKYGEEYKVAEFYRGWGNTIYMSITY